MTSKLKTLTKRKLTHQLTWPKVRSYMYSNKDGLVKLNVDIF